MPDTLTATERQLLTRLEAAVDRGLTGTSEALSALLEIQRRQLYRAVDADWWGYVRQRWPQGERHIRRLLVREEVAANVTAPEEESDQIGQPAPSRVREPNEGQARELNRLTGQPDAQRQVWNAVLTRAKAADQRVTAKVVRQAVDQYLRATAPDDPPVEEIRAGQEETKRQSLLIAEREAISRAEKALRKIADSLRPHRGTAARAILVAVDAAILVAEEHAG